MLRTLFIGVFLSLYILIVGPPLLVYTWITRKPDPIYWAGVNGVMFFVRAVGVRVRVQGLERIPPGVCLFVANHTSFYRRTLSRSIEALATRQLPAWRRPRKLSRPGNRF